MTKEKGILDSTEHTTEQSEVEQRGLKPKRRSFKKKARIVEIAQDVDPDYAREQQLLEQLFANFSQTFESPPLPGLPPIPNGIKNDYLLNRLMPEYNKKRQQYEQVVQEIRSRWNACHTQSGYNDYLSKLINHAITKLTPLNQNIQALQQGIVKRVQLLSIQPITEQDLLTAKRKLICALEVFILSLSVLRLKPQEYPEATVFKQNVTHCLQDLHHRLNHQEIHLNTNAATKLMDRLLEHLGLHQSIFGLYVNTAPKPINYEEINTLYNALFQTEDLPNNRTQQYLALYDLLSRLKHYPIYTIKKHEHLYIWHYGMQELLIETRERILETLKQSHSLLSQKNSLFIGVASQSCLRDSDNLLKEIDCLAQHVSQHFRQTNSDRNTSKSVIELQQLTQLQEETRLKLASIEQQACDIEKKTRLCLLQLDVMYAQELRYLLNSFGHNIQNAKQVSSLYGKTASQVIENAVHVFEELNHDKTEHPLSTIKHKVNEHHHKLNHYINEFKSELKKEWANHIFQLLSKQYVTKPCTAFTPMHSILMHMRIQNEPYQHLQLHPHNPFMGVLKEHTKDCNESLNRLIHYFSKLESLSGDQLESWIKEIKKLCQQCHQNVSQHKSLSYHAQTIETRLQSRSYRASLKIIKIIINELNVMLQKLSEIKCINAQDHSFLKSMLDNPKNLVLHSELSSELVNLLQQRAPQFLKLLTLIKEFQHLNAELISLDVTLCIEDDYIPKLLAITGKHLTDDCREFYSRGLANTNNYIEWLHLYVYKPLLQFYVPKLAIEEVNLPEQIPHHIAFFSQIPKKQEMACDANPNGMGIGR